MHSLKFQNIQINISKTVLIKALKASFVAFISTQAQQVYFCNSHTETGEPVDARNVWSIKPWGSLIYILFDNEGEAYETQLNYMFLDRYVDGDYKSYLMYLIEF